MERNELIEKIENTTSAVDFYKLKEEMLMHLGDGSEAEAPSPAMAPAEEQPAAPEPAAEEPKEEPTPEPTAESEPEEEPVKEEPAEEEKKEAVSIEIN